METTSANNGHVIPWNKGKLLGQKPPLRLKEIWASMSKHAGGPGRGKIGWTTVCPPPDTRYRFRPSRHPYMRRSGMRADLLPQ